jgi:hypothetical protein
MRTLHKQINNTYTSHRTLAQDVQQRAKQTQPHMHNQPFFSEAPVTSQQCGSPKGRSESC